MTISKCTEGRDRFATAFAIKDGVVREESRFVLGFSAVVNMGGRQFAIVAPTMDALEIAFIDATKYPLDSSRVQKVGIVAQQKIK